MGKKKVALIIKTDGIEYDDRIRKEILSIQELFPDVKFKIFAFVPDNRSEQGICEYGVPYELISLKTREKFRSGKHKLLKAFEFYVRIRKEINNYDIIWCADTHVFLFPLFLSKKRKIVWDLHEIPIIFCNSKFKRKIFNYIENKCSLFYHANGDRIQYLKGLGLIQKPEKHYVIRNYPDKLSDDVTPYADFVEYNNFCDWLRDSKCIYLQGIYGKERRSYESMASIMEIDGVKAVVVGRPDKRAVENLICKYGEERVNEKLYFTGMIPQKYTQLFINKCQLSLIFYSINIPNNKYCEPNRLFQTVLSGLPVVVGCNPPMKEFVDNLGAGITLKSDGENISEIISGIKNILDNINYYQRNILKNKSHMYWDCQNELIKKSFSKII